MRVTSSSSSVAAKGGRASAAAALPTLLTQAAAPHSVAAAAAAADAATLPCLAAAWPLPLPSGRRQARMHRLERQLKPGSPPSCALCACSSTNCAHPSAVLRSDGGAPLHLRPLGPAPAANVTTRQGSRSPRDPSCALRASSSPVSAARLSAALRSEWVTPLPTRPLAPASDAQDIARQGCHGRQGSPAAFAMLPPAHGIRSVLLSEWGRTAAHATSSDRSLSSTGAA